METKVPRTAIRTIGTVEILLTKRSKSRNRQDESKQSAGLDPVITRELQELAWKAICQLKQTFSVIITRLCFDPKIRKTDKVIMLAKSGNPQDELSFYQPITLLPVISKLFEELLHGRLLSLIIRSNIIPEHQFAFRNKHVTTEQVRKILSIQYQLP